MTYNEDVLERERADHADLSNKLNFPSFEDL